MSAVDNTIYDRLGDRWYDANDDPVALLRAEARQRNPWIAQRLPPMCRVLDIGCGAGFLSNALAAAGHHVTGLDAAPGALAVARRHDASDRADYIEGDALALPFPSMHFDAVCAMDFLEHVEDPARVVAEAARVLRPGGQFFFHTFNRSWLAWLVVIKGVEWFVKNVPRDMHVRRLFVKPSELAAACASAGMHVIEMVGSRPAVGARLLRLAATGVVPTDFEFVFTPSLAMGYVGVARREHGMSENSKNMA